MTCLRIVFSAALLFIRPEKVVFFVLYLLCGVSDILDGWLARFTGSESRLGAVLDSGADFFFISAVLYKLLPVMAFPPVVLWGIGIVVLLRLCSLVVGFVRFRTLAFLHTYLNKATGFLLFCYPLVHAVWSGSVPGMLVCAVAVISALEELYLNLTAKLLDRDRMGFWSREKNTDV